MLKDKKGQRSHKRTKHSGMGGCGTSLTLDEASGMGVSSLSRN